MRVPTKRIDPDALIPERMHEGDAGADLRACHDGVIPPHSSAMVGTGIAVEIPPGYVGLQFPRSGLGSKGITLRNAVGVIDSGYRGEVRMPVWNTTDDDFEFHRGDRLTQLVVVWCEPLDFHEVNVLTTSDRDEDGFGSTGV